jgi:hypothetical protein
VVAYQPKAFWLTDYQPNECGSVGSVGEGLRKLLSFHSLAPQSSDYVWFGTFHMEDAFGCSTWWVQHNI